jgi:hypothetical protein
MANTVMNKQPLLYSFRLPPQQLPDLIKALQDVMQFAYLMADFWNGGDFIHKYDDGFNSLSARTDDCTQGSVFGESGELRWRRVGSVMRAALSADLESREKYMLENSCQQLLAQWQANDDASEKKYSFKIEEMEMTRITAESEDGKVLLWGTKLRCDRKTWGEMRIPKPLEYPIELSEITRVGQNDYSRVEMHYRSFFDSKGLMVAFFRTGLNAFLQQDEGEPEANAEDAK